MFMQRVILSCLFFCMMHAVFSQQTFSGQVIDENGRPLPGVTIVLGKNLRAAVSDSLGRFHLDYNSRHFLLTFSSVGYTTLFVSVKGNLPPVIKMFRNNAFLENTTVTAFSRNATLQRVPASVSLLTKNDLQRFDGTSLIPALNTVPGVKMDERSPGSYRLSIRGNLLRSAFGVRNIKVYWNGIPFTDANGNTYLNILSLDNIGRIELIKGPAGSMYGSGTGGVMLMSSQLSTDKAKNISVRSAVGSDGLWMAHAGYVRTGTNVQSLNYDHLQTDGYRAQSAMHRDVFHYNGSFLVNSRNRLSANILYSDLYYETPGGLTLAELKANPRQARPAAGAFPGAEAQHASIKLKSFYAGVGNEWKLSQRWTNTTGLYSSYTDFKNPAIRNYEDKYERGYGGRTVFQYKGSLFDHVIGAEYLHGFTRTGTYGNRLGVKDTLQYLDEIASRQCNVFVQSSMSFGDDITFTGGLSYNNFYYGFSRLSETPLRSAHSGFQPQLVPRLAVLYSLGKFKLFATTGKGYSPPSIDEVHASDGIFNRALKAETGTNYEAGFKSELVKGKLWLDASYYIFGLRNTIVTRRDASGADYYVNAGKTKQRGLEASAVHHPVNKTRGTFRNVKLFANYAYIKARFENYKQGLVDYDGHAVTGTPSNVFAAGTDISMAGNFYANLTYTYTDHIPLNDANTFYARAYNLLQFRPGYKINMGKTVHADFYASITHSFNKRYSLGNDLNAAGNRFFNPSAIDQYVIGVRLGSGMK